MLGDCYCKKYKTLFPRNNKKEKQLRNKEKSLVVMRIDHKLLRGMLRYVDESIDIFKHVNINCLFNYYSKDISNKELKEKNHG